MLENFKKIAIRTIAVIIAVGFLFFAMVNRQVVTLELTPLPFVIETRLFMLVALLMVAGIFIGWIVASFECRRRYLVKKETAKRLAALENEVTALRAHQHAMETAQMPRNDTLPTGSRVDLS